MSEQIGKYRDWGIDFRSSDIPHSREFRCLYCGWLYQTLDAYECVVGFRLLRRPPPLSYGGESIGIVVIECPKCFEKFWLHLKELSVLLIKNYSSKWPIR